MLEDREDDGRTVFMPEGDNKAYLEADDDDDDDYYY
jgi:hypothetical protein